LCLRPANQSGGVCQEAQSKQAANEKLNALPDHASLWDFMVWRKLADDKAKIH